MDKLPKGWDYYAWSDVLDIKNGKNQKAVLDENGKYPIYGSGGIMAYANNYLCNEGTTIIGRKGSINNPIYVESKFWNVDTAFGLSPNSKLDSKLLFYFCLGYDFTKHNKSTTLPSLTKSDLLKIQIPLPPLSEQKRIVFKLDALFECIDKSIALLEQNIKQTEALVASVLHHAFDLKGYNYVKASTVGKVIRGSSPRPKGDPRYYGGNVPRLMVADVTRDGMYVTPNIDFLTEEGALKSRPCPKGTLTIQVSGNPGTPSILNVDACIHDGFAAIINIDNSKWSSRFLYHYLTLKKLEYGALAKGATFQNIKTDIIRDFDIPELTLEQQEITSDLIESKNIKLDKLIKEQLNKLENLKALKESILDKAFKGEL